MLSLKKAQAAVEYLQTYGWAILVVIVVGIAIWGLGILGPHGRTNTASGFQVIKVLEPSIKYEANVDWETKGPLEFKVMNTAGIRIKIDDIEISGDCWACMLNWEVDLGSDEEVCANKGGIFRSGSCWMGETTVLDPGKTYIADTACDKLAKNEQFEVDVTFHFREKIGTEWIHHIDKGTIRGYAE